MTEILELAKIAATAAREKKANDVVILKMDEVTIITDYFVIATSSNITQTRSIADNIEKVMEENNLKLLSREGKKGGGWILLDYGSIIVHVFLEEIRRFYDLEALWGDAEIIEFEG